jgi:ubiquinone/menaquinone biosynthesis C-methylase UbiE
LFGFKELFDRNAKYINDKKNSICLGSRTGQEVLSLRNRGINSIGIDLVEFPPYTVTGDIHNLKYDSNTFDLVFCNIIDHCYDLNKAIFEMERICSLDGIIIINIQVNELGDEYSENIINDINSFELMFKRCSVLKSEKIKNSFDGMNHEIVFKKIEL